MSATINFNGKSFVFPVLVTEKGRTSKRQLLSTNENGQAITTEVKLTEEIQDKGELERVTALESKARQAMLKLTTPGRKGQHLLAKESEGSLRFLVQELQKEARSLNQELTTCHIDVDCDIVPIDLTIDAAIADKTRAHIQTMLTSLKALVIAPDMTKSPTQRYSAARNQYVACQHLVSWVSGLHADMVRAAITEAGDECIKVKSTPAANLPSLEAAIGLFDVVDVENSPQFAELPF